MYPPLEILLDAGGPDRFHHPLQVPAIGTEPAQFLGMGESDGTADRLFKIAKIGECRLLDGSRQGLQQLTVPQKQPRRP